MCIAENRDPGNELKRIEETLRESEERFRKVFEEGQFGMGMVNQNFFFIRANAAFCGMLGFSEQELVSLTLKDVTHPEPISGDAENLAKLFAGKILVYKTLPFLLNKPGVDL